MILRKPQLASMLFQDAIGNEALVNRSHMLSRRCNLSPRRGARFDKEAVVREDTFGISVRALQFVLVGLCVDVWATPMI